MDKNKRRRTGGTPPKGDKSGAEPQNQSDASEFRTGRSLVESGESKLGHQPPSSVAQSSSSAPGLRVPMPRFKDILLGRGRAIQSSNGNILMREITKRYRVQYCDLPRTKRRQFSEAVLDEILATGARFLKRVDSDQGEVWEVVDRETAHQKVSHSLREKALRDESEPGSNAGIDGPPNLQDNASELSLTASSTARQVALPGVTTATIESLLGAQTQQPQPSSHVALSQYPLNIAASLSASLANFNPSNPSLLQSPMSAPSADFGTQASIQNVAASRNLQSGGSGGNGLAIDPALLLSGLLNQLQQNPMQNLIHQQQLHHSFAPAPSQQERQPTGQNMDYASTVLQALLAARSSSNNSANNGGDSSANAAGGNGGNGPSAS